MLHSIKDWISKNYELTTLVIVYCCSFFFILTNTGIFWDDWTVYNVSNNGLEQQFVANGYYTFWALLKTIFFLFGDQSVFIFRLLTFVSYLLAGILLLFILRNIKEINKLSRLFIVLFFVTFPVNSAKISIVIVNHSLNYLLFFFGLWLFTIFLKNRSILLRILSLLSLFVSFFTPSLLVFYIIVIFYLLYYYKEHLFNFKFLFKLGFKYIDFFILPIVYWVFKKSVIVTSGLYADYNQIEQFGLSTFDYIMQDLKYSYIEVFKWSLPNSITGSVILLLLLFLFSIYFLLNTSKNVKVRSNFKLDIFFIGLGFIMFVAGTYAYIAVGKIPMLPDWHNRQQILVPLGASLLTFYGLKIIFDILALRSNVRNIIYILFLCIFMVANIKIYYDFEKDWLKQLSLMENFKTMEIFQDQTTFVFDDRLMHLNANGREYRFYEYTGLFKETFGDTTRLGQSQDLKKELSIFKKYKPYVYFNITDYTLTNDEYIIVIEEGSYKLNTINYMKLKYNSIFNKEAYKEDLKNIVHLYN